MGRSGCEPYEEPPSRRSGDGLVELNTSSDDPRGELHRAIRADLPGKSLYLTRKLLSNVNEQLIEGGPPPLGVACAAGSLEVANRLIEAGADPRACDGRGACCLAMAASAGHVRTVQAILDMPSCNVNQMDIYGRSSLHRAAAFGHMKVAEKLLKHKANPSLRAGKGAPGMDASSEQELTGETPLHTATRLLEIPRLKHYRGKRYEMFELLLKYGSDPLIADRRGDTVLHMLARRGDVIGLWLCFLFVDSVAEAVAIPNEAGVTVLQEAFDFGYDAAFVVHVAKLLPREMRRWWMIIWFNESLAAIRN